jgi:uncharacterized membrane protein
VPTDTARRTVEVDAPLDRVRNVLRDVAAQPLWVREVRTATVLEKYDDGTPAVARVTAGTPAGGDAFTVAYVHADEAMTWSLVEGHLQTAQDGRYSWQRLDSGRTLVAFELSMSHRLPVPGFVRRRVITDLVAGTLRELKAYVER